MLRKPIFLVVAIVFAVVIVIGGIRWFGYARSQTASNAPAMELQAIESAKQQWALEYHKTTNDIPTWRELLPYLPNKFANFYWTNGVVVRPEGGTYTIGRVGESSTYSTGVPTQ
jgi:hypothetical protein